MRTPARAAFFKKEFPRHMMSSWMTHLPLLKISWHYCLAVLQVPKEFFYLNPQLSLLFHLVLLILFDWFRQIKTHILGFGREHKFIGSNNYFYTYVFFSIKLDYFAHILCTCGRDVNWGQSNLCSLWMSGLRNVWSKTLQQVLKLLCRIMDIDTIQ